MGVKLADIREYEKTLKRCPFCGARAIIMGPEWHGDGEDPWEIACDGVVGEALEYIYCLASQTATTLDEAVRMWNRRKD